MLLSELETTTCANCGIKFAAPSSWLSVKRQEGGSLYCPNGHSLTFAPGENQKLKMERDRLKQRQAMLEDEAREERERADKAEKATKRLKKRASAGVCPCCNRTFANMAAHMKTKHPELVGDKVVKLKRPTK